MLALVISFLTRNLSCIVCTGLMANDVLVVLPVYHMISVVLFMTHIGFDVLIFWVCGSHSSENKH